jgi:uncharacterized SAM-binding protein YcdF (DUF218 family)
MRMSLKSRRRLTIRHGAVAGCIVIACLLLLQRQWLPLIGGFLSVTERPAPADALVPLAGDRSRVVYAADLFRQGYAPWYVVTDMWLGTPDPPVHYAAMVQRQAVSLGVSADRLLVAPGMPSSTYAEAVGLRQLAVEQGWRSLLVVTSPSHARRAGIILQSVFAGTGVYVQVVTVADHWYRAESWWTSPAGRSETALEYAKLLAFFIGVR